jgi:hypothetical protein
MSREESLKFTANASPLVKRLQALSFLACDLSGNPDMRITRNKAGWYVQECRWVEGPRGGKKCAVTRVTPAGGEVQLERLEAAIRKLFA